MSQLALHSHNTITSYRYILLAVTEQIDPQEDLFQTINVALAVDVDRSKESLH